MDSAKERSTMATLEGRRQALRLELTQVEKQINEAERAQARLQERIHIMERGLRQAA